MDSYHNIVMIRTFILPMILYTASRKWCRIYTPFAFPEGIWPDIYDKKTFETLEGINETELNAEIANVLNYTLENNFKWEETIFFNNSNTIITNWELNELFGGY